MKIDKDTSLYTSTCQAVFVAALAVLILSGCGNTTAMDEPVGRADGIDTNNCKATTAEDPKDKKKGAIVCIVFDSNNCPTKTVFAETPDGKPELKRGDSVQRLLWQAVNEISTGVYKNVDVDYRLVFDPFRGNLIKSKPGGWAQSKPLICQSGSDLSKCIPAPADYKYTVWTTEMDGDEYKCPPHDPVFRVMK